MLALVETLAQSDPFDLDVRQLVSHFARLACAFLLALPVAWNREREAHTAGLRTFPMVALASCGFALLGRSAFGEDANAQGHVLEGVITGIGFIGGGAILKQQNVISGTATATSIWITGGVGAAVAYDRYEIAVVLAFASFAILKWLKRFKPDPNQPLD